MTRVERIEELIARIEQRLDTLLERCEQAPYVAERKLAPISARCSYLRQVIGWSESEGPLFSVKKESVKLFLPPGSGSDD